jgi:hypothetical protein
MDKSRTDDWRSLCELASNSAVFLENTSQRLNTIARVDRRT